jgi:predicted RNA-binding protein YlxR (DUF448 family)
MTKKVKPRVKHIPQRTCVGCREVLEKRSLLRIVRTEEGIKIDPSGKLNGRGAYLHEQRSCWETGMKGSLAHALKMELSGADQELLKDHLEKLPAE